MACGVMGDALMVRVAPEATADDGDLKRWVRHGEEFAESLPPK